MSGALCGAWQTPAACESGMLGLCGSSLSLLRLMMLALVAGWKQLPVCPTALMHASPKAALVARMGARGRACRRS